MAASWRVTVEYQPHAKDSSRPRKNKNTSFLPATIELWSKHEAHHLSLKGSFRNLKFIAWSLSTLVNILWGLDGEQGAIIKLSVC